MKEKKKSNAAPKPRRAAKGRKPDAMARAQADIETEPVLDTTEETKVDDETRLGDLVTSGVARDGDEVAAACPPTEIGTVNIDVSDAREFNALVEATAPPAGPLVEMPPVSTARSIQMIDLRPHERRTLAEYASTFHRTDAQVEAFESGEPTGANGARAKMGTRRLVELGLVEERTLFLVTELGARVAQSGGVEVTRPVAKSSAAASS